MHAPCLIQTIAEVSADLPQTCHVGLCESPNNAQQTIAESRVLIDQPAREQPVSTGSIGQPSLLA
ncbi:MAG: hypothetical protein U0936_04020 [Planctomycetaceae bacterium]